MKHSFAPGPFSRGALGVACALLTCATLDASASHHATAGAWQPGFEAPVVWINAMTRFEGDLVMTGGFNRAGGVPTNNTARWNQQSWTGFPSEQDFEAHALVAWGSELVAAGTFAAESGETFHVGRWSGSAWEPLGEAPGRMTQVAVYAGELVAAGNAPEVDHVAAWDGNSWRALGSGMASTVSELAVHDGLLFAGVRDDSSDCVFQWDGSSWSPVGEGLHGYAREFVVWNNELLVEGVIRDTNGTVVADLASWDGSTWTSWGENFEGSVWVLSVTPEGDLIAGGTFTQAGSAEAIGVARWDGTDWSPMGNGLDGGVSAFAILGDALLAGGEFSLNGDTVLGALASWNGNEWTLIDDLAAGQGLDERVFALSFYGEDLVAGGSFYSAAGRRVHGIARWDGVSWHDLNGGVRGASRSAGVRALVEYDGELVAGGRFETAGGVAARNIATWDGVRWKSLGSGVDGTVLAFTVFEGDLIAAGAFTDAGGIVAPHIARWDGSRWSRLGHGFNDDVYALTVYDGDLIAAGLFTASSSGLQNKLARWTGSEWTDVGSGLGGVTLCALAVHRGELYAGGCRFWSHDRSDEGLLRWDGESWHVLARGEIETLTSFADQLIGGVSAWDGTSWTRLGSGVRDWDSGSPRESGVLALAARGSDLFVGGSFRQAGAHESYYIAHWKLVSTPVSIADFGAHASPDAVRVVWSLSQEALRDLARVFVERAEGSSTRFVSQTPAGLEPRASMAYLDDDVEPFRTYTYRIQLVDHDGSAFVSRAIAINTISPSRLTLEPPIEGEYAVQLRFGMTHARPVRLSVFDVRGRLIRSLDLGLRRPGVHVYPWDRHDARGIRAARGVYFVQLAVTPESVTRKLVLLRP